MKKYLSLYKTSSEHSSDNSRLVPNISLITDEQRLILTNENNNATIFKEVDIIESFDDIINRFPTGNSTSMPGLKIYMDNSEQSMAKNIKLFSDSQRWRSNYISNNGLSHTNQRIRINVDALLIDNIIMDKYDGNYQHYIDIYNGFFELMNNDGLYSVGVDSDGSVSASFSFNNIFPSPTETRMPYLWIHNDTSNNDLYDRAQQWRKDYISYKGLSDTGQPISMFVDKLNIDYVFMDEYDRYYHYHIDIYNDRIILLNNDGEEILTISSDGSVTILDIFNKFPSPTRTSSNMPGLKIYTDNTVQSKAENIKLYNDAEKYRKDYISNNDLIDTSQPIRLNVDAVMIDNIIIDEYDYNYNGYHYHIDIYNDHIILLNNQNSSGVLTISSDGSVENYITPTPTTTR